VKGVRFSSARASLIMDIVKYFLFILLKTYYSCVRRMPENFSYVAENQKLVEG
jgi:hypothetical protein